MHSDAPRGLEPLGGGAGRQPTRAHRLREAAQVRRGWARCCPQVIYGLGSCCPAGWPGRRGAKPGQDPAGKCDSAVLLLKLPGVWPVTRAAGALSRESQCQQWLYKVSREDTRGGKEFHMGGQGRGEAGIPGEIATAGRRDRKRLSPIIVQLGKQAHSGAGLTPRAHSTSPTESETSHSS